MLCLFAALQSANWQRVLATLSWPFYAAAGLSGLLLVSWYVFVRLGLGLAITVGLPTLPLETQVLLADIVDTMSRILVTSWLQWCLVLLGAGLLIQLIAFGVTRLHRRLQTRAAPEEKPRPHLRKQFR